MERMNEQVEERGWTITDDGEEERNVERLIDEGETMTRSRTEEGLSVS